VDRVTIDVSVVRDYLRDGRRQDPTAKHRHRAAVELFDLYRRGEVELAIAPQGFRDDADGGLGERLRACLEQERISELRQLPYVAAVTYPGEDFYPGEGVPGFREAWKAINESWHTHEGKRPGDEDLWHVETHLHESRDVLLTDDGGLLVMCRRLREEHGFPIVAMRLAEYIGQRRT